MKVTCSVIMNMGILLLKFKKMTCFDLVTTVSVNIRVYDDTLTIFILFKGTIDISDNI